MYIYHNDKGENKMIVKTIIDADNGRKWEISKKSDEGYTIKYYEYFNSIGWISHCEDTTVYSKQVVEDMFDIKL